MVFLVHLEIGYTSLYYKFEYLDNAIALTERIKRSTVKELSDDVNIKVTIEALKEEEFNKKIEETKGE